MENQYLIIGAGITGITIARILAEEGKKVVICEARETIGGNCYDSIGKENGGKQYIQHYGPHIFHTNDDEVWPFLSRFTKWQDYKHKVYAKIDGQLIHLPFNFSSIDKIFSKEEAERMKKKLLDTGKKKISILELRNIKNSNLEKLSNYVYNKVFLNYTIKQWGHTPDEMDPKVVGRVPIIIGYDEGYFPFDKYQGIPKFGLTKMFKKMLEHKNIIFKNIKVLKKDIKERYIKIVMTGPIDEFYNFIHGEIKYRSIFLHFEKKNVSSFQENSVINYPNEEDFTRITEYNKFLGLKANSSVISKEYASWDKGFKAYPLFTEENQRIINLYFDMAKKEKNILFAGRLAECKYYNIDQACARGMQIAKEIK